MPLAYISLDFGVFFFCFLTRVKRKREQLVPDAMYGNLSASGLATCGSDNTTTHPLPATTVTTTTPTAVLQNHPHLAGNEACRCPSCHLRDRFFPRNQDGRIFLPHPSLSIHSTRLSRSTTTTTNTAPPAIPVTRKRNRIESTTLSSDREWNSKGY